MRRKIAVFFFLIASPSMGGELVTVGNLLSQGYELKAVSKSDGDTGSGTTMWFQKEGEIVFCAITGPTVIPIDDKESNAIQMFSCSKLVVDSSIMKEMATKKDSN